MQACRPCTTSPSQPALYSGGQEIQTLPEISAMGSLPRLHTLALTGMHLRGRANLHELGGWAQLHHLSLYDCRLDVRVPAALRCPRSLTRLVLESGASWSNITFSLVNLAGGLLPAAL